MTTTKASPKLLIGTMRVKLGENEVKDDLTTLLVYVHKHVFLEGDFVGVLVESRPEAQQVHVAKPYLPRVQGRRHTM